MAQKRHEEFLKKDYYIRAARYFERETVAAKQFNSWTIRDPKSYIDSLEKIQAIEKLQTRRENLKQLLMKETDLYKYELEQQKQIKSKKNEDFSLKIFRHNLFEQKAEHSLYYPNVSRKLRSCPISLNDINKNLEHLRFRNRDDKAQSMSKNSYNLISSTDPSLERISFENDRKMDKENINLFQDCSDLLKISKTSEDKPTLLSNEQSNKSNYTYNSNNTIDINNINNVHQNEIDYNKEKEFIMNPNKEFFDNSEDLLISNQLLLDKLDPKSETVTKFMFPDDNLLNKNQINTYLNCDQNEKLQQKYSDCSISADISKQMFNYLQYNDLKYKIIDLTRREHIFTVKRCWSEALRLREMRNELILRKNKILYENRDLQIDNDTRQFGLNMIETRKMLNENRVKLCNSMFYSDEAKSLWKQWNSEDNTISKIEMNTMRNVILNELENEWKNLALNDKDHISQLYDRVITKSILQDEQKLPAVIQNAKVQ